MTTKPELDAIDHQLLQVLREDPRLSNRQIAERLTVTEGTIRNRIRRLQQNNVVAFTAIRRLDGKTLPSAAYIGLQVEGNRYAMCAMRWRQFPPSHSWQPCWGGMTCWLAR